MNKCWLHNSVGCYGIFIVFTLISFISQEVHVKLDNYLINKLIFSFFQLAIYPVCMITTTSVIFYAYSLITMQLFIILSLPNLVPRYKTFLLCANNISFMAISAQKNTEKKEEHIKQYIKGSYLSNTWQTHNVYMDLCMHESFIFVLHLGVMCQLLLFVYVKYTTRDGFK